MQIAHILKAPSIQVQHVSLYAAQQKATLSIISRRVSMHASASSLLLLPNSIEIYGACLWKTVWGCAVGPFEEQEWCETTTFVYSCMLCTTVNECEWTILRLLWLGGEQLVPGPPCPFICASWSVKWDLNGVKTQGKSHDSAREFLAKQLCSYCQ